MSQQRLTEALKDHLPERFSWEVRRCGRDFDAYLIIVDAVYRFFAVGDGIFTCDERAPYGIQRGVASAVASLC